MDKKNLYPAIKTLLAQMTDQYAFDQIRPQQTLRQLGITDESDIALFKTRMYRALSGSGRKLPFRKFYQAQTINLDSTVRSVLEVTHAALTESLPGYDWTKPKGAKALPGDEWTKPK